MKILNSVNANVRQTVLKDLQNFRKHKSKHFHDGINAFTKFIDDGENKFQSIHDFRYLLHTFMISEIILSKNNLITRINRYFDKQLTDEDNTYLMNKPIIDINYFGLLSVLLEEGDHTHQTFKTISQFIDMRQLEWNFDIIVSN